MDQVISLYREEIATYQQQIEDLKQRNRDCDQKNAALINKVQTLEDLVEKANVANRDLNIAFEHVHQENLRYQVSANNQDALAVNHPKQVTETDQRKEELTAESLVWISEREQFKQRNKFLERECERYHRDNMHLGKQVRHLLKTLEEERGMIIRRQSQVEEENRITCAADVIDKHLITFESIEELQQQNQKLLSLVKNLSAEQEEREVRVESEEVKRLTADLEELKSQLDTIKSDRERVLNALNTIHKERDLFKILLCKTRQVEHLTPEIFQRMVAVACSSGPAIAGPDSSSVEREAHIEDLKKMISNLERNIESIKKELDDSQAASAAELKVKNELLEKAHLKISEVMKTLEAANERNGLLESNINALMAEFDDIRTKCQKMTLELEDSNNKIENAENRSKELDRSLTVERNRAQDALIEASQFKEQSQLLLESLEREKQYRQQELASLFKDFQDKQSREFEARAEKQMEMQQRLNRAYSDIFNMQMQRNFERERRIRLDKLVNGRRKLENGRQSRPVLKFKRTQKRRQVRFSFVDQGSPRLSLNDSYMDTNNIYDSSDRSFKDTNNSPDIQKHDASCNQQQDDALQYPKQQNQPNKPQQRLPQPQPLPQPQSQPLPQLLQTPRSQVQPHQTHPLRDQSHVQLDQDQQLQVQLDQQQQQLQAQLDQQQQLQAQLDQQQQLQAQQDQQQQIQAQQDQQQQIQTQQDQQQQLQAQQDQQQQLQAQRDQQQQLQTQKDQLPEIQPQDDKLQHDLSQQQPQEQSQEEPCPIEVDNDGQIHESGLEPDAEFTTLESNHPQDYEILTVIENLGNHAEEDQNSDPAAKSGFIKLKRRKFD